VEEFEEALNLVSDNALAWSGLSAIFLIWQAFRKHFK